MRARAACYVFGPIWITMLFARITFCTSMDSVASIPARLSSITSGIALPANTGRSSSRVMIAIPTGGTKEIPTDELPMLIPGGGSLIQPAINSALSIECQSTEASGMPPPISPAYSCPWNFFRAPMIACCCSAESTLGALNFSNASCASSAFVLASSPLAFASEISFAESDLYLSKACLASISASSCNTITALCATKSPIAAKAVAPSKICIRIFHVSKSSQRNIPLSLLEKIVLCLSALCMLVILLTTAFNIRTLLARKRRNKL